MEMKRENILWWVLQKGRQAFARGPVRVRIGEAATGRLKSQNNV
jgi:hypothetical protein